MSTTKQQPKSKIALLPNQHVFNTQIYRKVLRHGTIIYHNRLLIIGLIASQLILAAWSICTINSINENKLNQQIINQESIPINLEPITI